MAGAEDFSASKPKEATTSPQRASEKKSAPPGVSPAKITTAHNKPGSVTVTPRGDYTSLSIAGQSPNGVASVSGKTLTFTPKTGYSGTSYFTYTATGPGGTSLTGTVTVVVAPPPGLVQLKQLETLSSTNKQSTLTLQNDGNLILKKGSAVVWQTGTWNTPANVLSLMPNGDVELRSPTKVIWKADTAGLGGVAIEVRDDGAWVVVNRSGVVVWRSDR